MLLGGASQTASGEWDLVGSTIGSLDQICGYVVGDGLALIHVDNTMNWESLTRGPGSWDPIVDLGTILWLEQNVGGPYDYTHHFYWVQYLPD